MVGLEKIYTCSKCDAQSRKWSGRCLDCGAWGTIIEEAMERKEFERRKDDIAPAQVIDLAKTENKDLVRLETGMGELDRVLGGGIVPGSLVLISGEPGIGKSTLLAQIANSIDGSIYVSGEESAGQVKDRLKRLNCDLSRVRFVSETNLEKIEASLLKEKPPLAIIDSIQTISSAYVPNEAGNITQIRVATMKFLELAKENNLAIIVVGHVTKDGTVAGPKSLEHIVDTVIYLEAELKNDYRILRATKNRFGSVNEIGIFEMTNLGFVEVKNPSAIFVDDILPIGSGSVLSAVMEGTRPFLVEIQALASKTVFGYPQRKASGFDINRLQILTAVITKRTKLNLSAFDVILNVVGGLKISDPSLDLAVCFAIAASLLNQVIARDTIILGEVGLGGEVRNVAKLKERLEEARKLGFKKAIIPNVEVAVKGLELVKVKRVEEGMGLV